MSSPVGFGLGAFFGGTYICIYKPEPDFSIKNLSIFRGSQIKPLKWFHFDMLIRHQSDDWMYSENGDIPASYVSLPEGKISLFP